MTALLIVENVNPYWLCRMRITITDRIKWNDNHHSPGLEILDVLKQDQRDDDKTNQVP